MSFRDTFPEIEQKCLNKMKIFRNMTILLSCLILMYCILPLVVLFSNGLDADIKPFPYQMIFPYDAHHGWKYPLTYLFTSYAGICVVTTLFAEDSIFGFFLTYTCGQFEILHKQIDDLMLNAHEKVIKTKGHNNAKEKDFQNEYVRQLNEIANRHNKLMQ